MILKNHSSVFYTLPKALILLFLLLLAGCGVTTSVAGTSNNSSVASGTSVASSPSSAATPTVPGTPTVAGIGTTSTGCPSATQVVQWPSPPTVIITSAEASKGAALQVGQTLEIALHFGSRWLLGLTAGQPELVFDTPAGYGDASLQSCVWRFTAEQAGQVTLFFTFAPICQPHMDCPQYLGILKIAVDVLPQ